MRPSSSGQRGILLLATLFLCSLLMILLASALHRTTTELLAARRFAALTQAFYLADAGVDEAIQEIRARAFLLRPKDDPEAFRPALSLARLTGKAEVMIAPMFFRFDPLATFGEGQDQRFGSAHVHLFSVQSRGTAARTTRTVTAVAGARRQWVGAAALEQIYIEPHPPLVFGQKPNIANHTYVRGSLRTNFGSIKAGGVTTDSHPIEIPSSATVNADVFIGPPSDADPDDTLWSPYRTPVTQRYGSPLDDDGVWVQGALCLVGYPWAPPENECNPPLVRVLREPELIPLLPRELLEPPRDASGGFTMDCSETFTSGPEAIKIYEGGTLCYQTYTVQTNQTVLYRKPTVIYLTGTQEDSSFSADSISATFSFFNTSAPVPSMLVLQDNAHVGQARHPDAPASPLAVLGGVSFRSTRPHRIELGRAAGILGTIVAPYSELEIRSRRADDTKRVRTVTGAVLVKRIHLLPGAFWAIVPATKEADWGLSVEAWGEHP